MRPIFIFLLGTILCGTAWAAFQTDGGTAASSGIFTMEQAARGADLYQSKCATCHSPDLSGGGTSPALAGPDFSTTWSGKPVSALFTSIRNTMPSDHPRTLTTQQVADLVAFLLKVNKFPAGKTELPTDTDRLKGILIDDAQ